MTEPNKPLDQMTVQERLDLGRSYFKEGKFDEAITVLKTISTSEDPTIYAMSQGLLGSIYMMGLGRLDKAITAWSNIRRNDNPEAYAQAQLGLGAIYKSQNELDKATTAWSNITRQDNPETYTQAQFNLGNAYQDQGKLDEAITAWSNICRSDNPETYAGAQLNLGNAYCVQNKLDEAITVWSNIRHDDNRKAYTWAQDSLGDAYYIQNKLDEAITAWSNIRRSVDPETYAHAQFGLGSIYHTQNKVAKAISTWKKVHRNDNPEAYARAQFNLGLAYHTLNKPDDAIEVWSNITRDDNPEIYAQAQFVLGKIYEDEGDLERAKEAYCNAQDFFYYNYERVKRILECPPKVIKKLRDIAKNTDEILKSLQIIPDFESRVAHYSRASTAFTLFGIDKNPSNFRLSTIRGVNDPTEGLVLGKYWDQQGIPEIIHTNNTATFISCFTFNHDSLNQFRLYGKEDGREATGVSLVFNEEFFSDQSDVLKFIAAPSTDPSSKPEQIKPNDTGKTESDSKKPSIGKSTLYRCIYLDPKTGYWTLGQRDKSTFYRQYKKAEEEWGKYQGLIQGKEGCIKKHLFDNNNSILSILKSIFKNPNAYSAEEKQKILEAVRFILLPLQYLVKHIAFQEEQECRIMYITQFRDEKIHSDREKQWMYVEYKEPVLPHIDKIWLSPGAAKDQDFFRILLDKGENDHKVRISQNPFRNKE